MDATYHMYYADVFNLQLQDLENLEMFNIEVMDVMKKECMTFFHKQLKSNCSFARGQKISKVWILDAFFDKWLHKAIFWF
jgi:hypothetical protein